MKNLDLAWERLIDGKTGIYKAPKKATLTPGLLRNLAASKMVDVTLISANFFDELVFFRPRVSLLIESGYTLKFIGIYYSEELSSADELNDTSENLSELPSICIRTGFWDGKKDFSEFMSSNDKENYILGVSQAETNIFFMQNEPNSSIENLTSETIKLVKDGISLHNAYVKSEYSEINLTISDGNFCSNLTYDPRTLENIDLNNIINRWVQCLVGQNFQKLVTPDDTFRISYIRSIFDYIDFTSSM
jgi:hypothetical protein